MIPSPWIAFVLAFAAYRITRLIGWDDFPPVARARDWATGATSFVTGTQNSTMGLTSEKPQVVWTYKRPTLSHMLGCGYCLGFWVSLVVYAAWVFFPTETLYASAAFALNAAVALIARWLDS